MVSFPYGTTVTLIRRTVGGRDSDNNDVYVNVEVDIDGCAVWPTGSAETDQGRDTVTSSRTVIFPPGTVVKATDQARIDGELYDIDGTPNDWSSPLTGHDGGVEVRLVRVTG